MLMVCFMILIKFKLHFRLPYNQICMVSSHNGPLKHTNVFVSISTPIYYAYDSLVTDVVGHINLDLSYMPFPYSYKFNGIIW